MESATAISYGIAGKCNRLRSFLWIVPVFAQATALTVSLSNSRIITQQEVVFGTSSESNKNIL